MTKRFRHPFVPHYPGWPGPPALALLLLLGGCTAAREDEVHRLSLLDTACSAAQRAIIDDAMATARVHLARAIRLVRGDPPHPHIQRWFGTAHRSLVLSTLAATAEAMAPPLGLDLRCNNALRCMAGIVAYASPAGRLVAVCPPFFSAPDEGQDSRYGALIHEMTHVAANTADHAYQPAAAERLPKVAPLRAADNADNYQYFVETLPR
ncbi:M35 family metallopeptidase [Falsiroseomonas oryziterrae]|uniref:M35 family metallopeptidase n=1 Tax=Falsiroseomonas oryziterrae TaxID=2911368 RepID=UPI001F025F81|nr:M35 family metallo-endopeptidase [Roseomonas sp. NPKOSM-4]